MAFPQDIHVTNGVPDLGTGTVKTIDGLIASGLPITSVAGVVAVTQSGAWNVGQTGAWTVQPGNTANTTPWLVKLSDGTNTPTIKSGAPVVSDMGLMVQLHPNSLNTNGPKTSVNSAPAVLPTDAQTLAIAFDTTQLMNGVSGAALTPTKNKITATLSGTYTMVTAQAGKKIRLLSMYLNSTVANTINLQSHVTTTNNDGHPAYSATGGMVLPFNPIGWFDSTVGEALDMVVGSNGEVSGQFSWIAV